ncbi:MAG TPA: CPBP family glutamic-type intramembrane protease, partial [Spirochaetia bacterium]|nr:CPBP family glutamic-type intramembrane protease [Spirochaetia bacterium]
QTFDELVAQEARKGFQYRFERHLLYDNLRAGALAEGPLRAMAEALNSEAFIGLLHTVMSAPFVPGETFCDGQLTRYRAGHFLTSHDDGLPEFNRIAAFVVNLTSGPLGEELGWRGYALPRLRRTRSTTASGLLLGLVWGFWHLPLWLMSGFSGPDLLRYVLAFLAAIVSVSVLIAHALERNRNILLAVWIHFWFNFLVQLAGIDILALMTYIAVGYGFAAVLVVALAERRPAAP